MAKPLIRKGQIKKGFSSNPDLSKAPEVEDSKPEKGSILDQVEGELARDGIIPFNASNIMEEYLQLPADMTESTSKELGRYFNAFTQQKMYCRTLLGRVSAILREETEELDDIRDKVYRDLPAKMSVKEKDLKLRSHEKYSERASVLLETVARLEEKKNMLSIYLDNLVDGIFNISREISRREADLDHANRQHNVENKRRR